MYPTLLLPWSPDPTPSELTYRASSPHAVRTKGTIFLTPPPDNALRDAFHAPPRPHTRMSAGAVALTKHFERNPTPVQHPRLNNAAGEGEARRKDAYKLLKRRSDETHPFWVRPMGSNEEKTQLAGEVLERMLREARWRNVMLLHEGVAVYEVRMGRGWGMRWTLGLERVEEEKGVEGGEKGVEKEGQDGDMTGWKIGKVTFRGFLEPIAGLDHELETEDTGEDGEELETEGTAPEKT